VCVCVRVCACACVRACTCAGACACACAGAMREHVCVRVSMRMVYVCVHWVGYG